MKIGFISDAHGHTGAFVSGLKLLELQRCDQVFFLGDAIGYLPGRDVVQLVRTLGLASILGNHEAMLLSSESPKNDEVHQLARCRAMLTDEDFVAISQWPAERTLEIGGRNVRLMHGSPSDVTYGYAYPDSDLDRFACAPGSITVMGNTHRPFWRENVHGAFFLNPGSCGLPRDCGGLGSVAILDTGGGSARILRFDIAETAREALASCTPVHHSVVALFDRPRPSHLVGEIYGS